ncbi:MAG: hypothetical protein R3300_22075, partial [Candidatus Promineifilaceae bacterium]|nr:hypothetical protein [Candidatus Promineifilaceae bacterium]
IPAYNEAARIGPVVAGAAAHLPVLVVDDGSSDVLEVLINCPRSLRIAQTSRTLLVHRLANTKRTRRIRG